MAEFDNTNRGVLFTNDRKTTDKHPDLNGSININGIEHWFAGWWKSGAKGDFLSLSVGKPKDEPPSQQPARRAAPPMQRPAAQSPRPAARPAPAMPARGGSGFDDMDSDVPF